MSNIDYTPLVNPADSEPGTIGAAAPVRLLPQMKNYASAAVGDGELRQQIRELYDICTQTRQDRGGLEDEWKAIDKMVRLEHDDGQRYKGRSNNYVPAYLRNKQTQVTAISRGLFPSADYLSVDDARGVPDGMKAAKAVEKYLKWEFETNARLPFHMKRGLSPYTDYGLLILKHQFRRKTSFQGGRRKMTPDEMASVMAGTMPEWQKKECDGFMVTSRSPYNWYVYPASIDSLDEAQVVFEDVVVSRAYVEAQGRAGAWENVEHVLAGHNAPPEFIAKAQHQAAASGTASDTDGPLAGNAMASRHVLTEAWCYLRLPKDAYMPEEDPREPLPARVLLCSDVPVSVTRNPLFSQRPPYEVSVQNASPGHFYGFGIGRVVRNLQYLINDFMNQTNDAGIYGLNPVVLANPGLMAAPLRPISPGVVWNVTDVGQAVKFDRPPVELVQWGQMLTSNALSMAMDFGGAPPILQGTNAGKGAKTATSAQILQRNALMPLQDVVEDIERDVMVRLMQACFSYALQYRKQEVMAWAAGEAIQVLPEHFLIEPAFRWNASNQAVNQQMRAQQSLHLLQVLLNPAIQQALLMRQRSVNPEVLIRRVWSDGFGMPDYDQLVTSATMGQMAPMAMQMMQGMQQQQQGGAPQGDAGGAPGERVRSTLEQQPGAGDVEPTPGEGEDFGAVREGADDISAMLGAALGGNNG